jgi:hypothetical protein
MAGVIFISQGSQSGVFAIHTVPVIALDSAGLSASAGGVIKSNTLLILPFPSIRMSRDTVVGGSDVDVVATLPAPSPVGDVLIEIQSSVDSVAHPFSPGRVYEGSTQGYVNVSTFAVDANVSVTFTATNARSQRRRLCSSFRQTLQRSRPNLIWDVSWRSGGFMKNSLPATPSGSP